MISLSCLTYIWCAMSLADYIEVTLFCIIGLLAVRTCLKARQYTLLHTAFGYALLYSISVQLNLVTISNVVLLLAPALMALLIVLYQHRISNAYCHILEHDGEQPKDHSWVLTLIQQCVNAMHTGQPLTILILNKHVLSQYLTIKIPCKIPLTPEHLSVIKQHKQYVPQQMIVCSPDGLLLGANTTFNITQLQNAERLIHHTLEDLARIITKAHDAVLLQVTPEEQAYTIIAQGTLQTCSHVDTLVRIVYNLIGIVPPLSKDTHELEHTTQQIISRSHSSEQTLQK